MICPNSSFAYVKLEDLRYRGRSYFLMKNPWKRKRVKRLFALQWFRFLLDVLFYFQFTINYFFLSSHSKKDFQLNGNEEKKYRVKIDFSKRESMERKNSFFRLSRQAQREFTLE